MKKFVRIFLFFSHAHNCVVTTDFRMIGAFVVVFVTTSDETSHGDTISSIFTILTADAVLVAVATPFPLRSVLRC